jgi:cyclohexyl-isocyanide hydratase
MDLLPLVGAIPVHDRVVVDRDRITGGGVTAGIDIALAIVTEARGARAADRIRLELEYGDVTDPTLRDEITTALAPRLVQRGEQLRRIFRGSD